MKTVSPTTHRLPYTHSLILFAGLIILLSIPAAAYLSNWQWSPDQINHNWAKFFFFCSKSAHAIAGIIITLLIIFKLNLRLKQAILIFLLIAIATIGGAAIKSAIKNYRQEPRPYVVWLEKENYLDSSSQFYELPHKSAFIRKLDLSAYNLPTWLQGYWAKNTSYSFPSGHSLFAAQLALFMLLFLWRLKAYTLITVTMGWAVLVETSCLYLGMHWPIDIAVSCLIGFILVFIAGYINHRWILKK